VVVWPQPDPYAFLRVYKPVQIQKTVAFGRGSPTIGGQDVFYFSQPTLEIEKVLDSHWHRVQSGIGLGERFVNYEGVAGHVIIFEGSVPGMKPRFPIVQRIGGQTASCQLMIPQYAPTWSQSLMGSVGRFFHLQP
jgi:hypothetical protein